MSANCLINIPGELTEAQLNKIKITATNILKSYDLEIGWMYNSNSRLIQSGKMKNYFYVFANEYEECSLDTSFMEDYVADNACKIFSEHFKYYKELVSAIFDIGCSSVELYLDHYNNVISVEDFRGCEEETTPDKMLELMFEVQKEDFLEGIRENNIWGTGFPTLKLTVKRC